MVYMLLAAKSALEELIVGFEIRTRIKRGFRLFRTCTKHGGIFTIMNGHVFLDKIFFPSFRTKRILQNVMDE